MQHSEGMKQKFRNELVLYDGMALCIPLLILNDSMTDIQHSNLLQREAQCNPYQL